VHQRVMSSCSGGFPGIEDNSTHLSTLPIGIRWYKAMGGTPSALLAKFLVFMRIAKTSVQIRLRVGVTGKIVQTKELREDLLRCRKPLAGRWVKKRDPSQDKPTEDEDTNLPHPSG